jgi:DNA-binding SARP family transcriptional activator
LYRHHTHQTTQHTPAQHTPAQHTLAQRHDTSLEWGAHDTVEISVLGGFRVTVAGHQTPSRAWSRRSAAALVKILALAPGHRLHREKMMDLLWPDESPERSAPRLHKAAHFARRAAGSDDAIVLRDDVVWLFPGAHVTVDAVRFEQLARKAISEQDSGLAREALGWYGGELLPADPYEDWAADRRESLHLRQLDVLRVIGEWRELVDIDPTNEQAHIELMQRHLAAGDGAAALRQYEHLERVLDRELGVSPGTAAREAREAAVLLDWRADEGGDTTDRVEALLDELARLETRQSELLAELAAAGAEPRCTTSSDG